MYGEKENQKPSTVTKFPVGFVTPIANGFTDWSVI